LSLVHVSSVDHVEENPAATSTDASATGPMPHVTPAVTSKLKKKVVIVKSIRSRNNNQIKCSSLASLFIHL
jgi:hypothetical protein